MSRRLLLGSIIGAGVSGILLWKFIQEDRKPFKQHPGSSYEHFQALREWRTAISAGNAMGQLQGEVYCEIWLQRYADGLIINC